MTTPSAAAPNKTREPRYAMSEGAFARLTDEESRLLGIALDLSAPGPQSEAPDAAVVASSIREVDVISRRLSAIREALAAADISRTPDEAIIGRSVRIREDGAADTFRLVISGAGDPAHGAISIDSPLGGALLGSRPGDEVEYATPGGQRSATVESVGEDDSPPF